MMTTSTLKIMYFIILRVTLYIQMQREVLVVSVFLSNEILLRVLILESIPMISYPGLNLKKNVFWFSK